MFALAILKHTVQIAPQSLGSDLVETLIQRINEHFANYVIPNVGLCITFHDFKKIGESFILPGDACTYTPTVFRYVVFQPFVGEILEGSICKSTREGLAVSLHFFQDIYVEPDKLPPGSKFDDATQIWSWEFEGEDGEPVRFYMEPSKKIRVRVASIHYENVEPGASTDLVKAFSIKGMGCVDWWESDPQQQQGAPSAAAPAAATAAQKKAPAAVDENDDSLIEVVD